MNVLMGLDGVCVAFPARRRQRVVAVSDVTLDVLAGETLGLIGESGSGKSTLARSMLGLVPVSQGAVTWRGAPVSQLDRAERRELRRSVQMIFQDPHSALDPRRTVLQSVREPLDVMGLGEKSKRDAQARALLQDVGLSTHLHERYPHQLSGGQKQRVNIARALVTRPRMLVCDESVSALDVALQAEILNLLQDLKAEYELTIVFISHDLAVVGHVADRIAVMYLGRLVEVAPTDALFSRPMHPYSEALLSAQPDIRGGSAGRRILLEGDVPSPLRPPPGCRFHTRCAHSTQACAEVVPLLGSVGEHRESACLRVDDLYERPSATVPRSGR